VFKAKALLKTTHSTSLRAWFLRQPFCFVHRPTRPALLKQKNLCRYASTPACARAGLKANLLNLRLKEDIILCNFYRGKKVSDPDEIDEASSHRAGKQILAGNKIKILNPKH
jgi:hypothetical protein